jgi:DnaJ-domain-containing protein 1
VSHLFSRRRPAARHLRADQPDAGDPWDGADVPSAGPGSPGGGRSAAEVDPDEAERVARWEERQRQARRAETVAAQLDEHLRRYRRGGASSAAGTGPAGADRDDRPPGDEPDVWSDDPYVVLGVPSSASWEEIQRAHRQLARRYHPDKVAALDDRRRAVAEEVMFRVNDAYRELKVRRGR